jgi:DNA-binding NtrC family response regulator
VSDLPVALGGGGRAEPSRAVAPGAASGPETPHTAPVALPAAAIPSGPIKDVVRDAVAAIERELIVRMLKETGGNVTRAAERLGLSRKGLQLKLRDLAIPRLGEPTS